jgi:4-hydroxybenzoate polyprenyltransferase
VFRVINYIQSLSIVVALGAVCSSSMFLHLFLGKVSWEYNSILFCCVWSIYLFDDIIDSDTMKTTQNRLRMAVILVLLVFVGLTFHRFILEHIPFFAIGLVLIVIYYSLVLLEKGKLIRRYPKELLIAATYIYAVVSFPISQISVFPSLELTLPIISFSALVFANVFLFGLIDVKKDVQKGAYSMVIRLGNTRSERVVFVLILTSVSLCGIAILYGEVISSIVILTIALFHAIIANRADKGKVSRFLLDAIFILPILYLVAANLI